MSRQLEHAEMHNVPPKYLVGFIYQTGGKFVSQLELEEEESKRKEKEKSEAADRQNEI